MKTCPTCQRSYPDDVESCPRDSSRLVAEIRDERGCPYCAELILKKARVCKHCGHDVEPILGPDTPAQAPSPAPTQGIPETQGPQPPISKPAAAGVRPPAASKTPWLRPKPEPFGIMKYVALGGAVLFLVVAGVWYFSHRKMQPTQMAKGNATAGKPVLTAGTVQENPKDGLKYVWIPPGTFMMGCSPGDKECRDDEKPAHQVTITKGFWIGQTEVTVGAYRRFTGVAGRQMPYAPYYDENWADANMPMTDVMWNEAHDYCGWMGGRLPTEAEWEYAARGGSTESRYSNIDEIAWYGGNSGNRAHEAAQKRANGFGLYDMLGNLGEYVNDWYDPHYYQNSPLQDPAGPSSGFWHVSRGGFYLANTVVPTVSMRLTGEAGSRQDMGGWGFRCAGESLPIVPLSGSERAQQEAEAERKRQAEEKARKIKETLGDELEAQAVYKDEMASGYQIQGLRVFINRKTGMLTITFGCHFSTFMKRNGEHMLVRLFDANGEYLTHFMTKEYFFNPTFWSQSEISTVAVESELPLKEDGNVLQYSVNLRDAAFAKKVEFGPYHNW